jgi:uncharacterized protein involved in cysteine biosynthesis
MNIIKSVYAILQGLLICLTRPKVRKLAMWPWLVGMFCYSASIYLAYLYHGDILARMVDSPDGWLSYLIYGLAWVAVTSILAVGTLFITMVLVLILTSAFQTAIASAVLRELNEEIPEEEQGFSALLRETKRTAFVEIAKLFWLIPLFILLFIVGFIPILTPVAFLLGSWLLAYQFVDIVLDIYKLKSGKRLSFAIKNAVPVTVFGASLSLCWAIPLVGILLPPAAVAGAAWLMSDTALLKSLPLETSNSSSKSQ